MMIRYAILAGLTCLASSAQAQQPPAPPSFVPPVVTVDDWNRIMELLKPIPGEHSIPLFLKMQEMESRAIQAQARQTVPTGGAPPAAPAPAPASVDQK
jgi:hypothetical protein